MIYVKEQTICPSFTSDYNDNEFDNEFDNEYLNNWSQIMGDDMFEMALDNLTFT